MPNPLKEAINLKFLKMKKIQLAFLLVFSLSLLMTIGCSDKNKEVVDPTIIQVPSFNAIKVSGQADVILEQGDFLVKAKSVSDRNLTVAKVSNGVLEISGQPTELLIRVPDLTAITLAGQGDVRSNGRFNFKSDLTVLLSDQGDLDMAGEMETGKIINLTITESGDFNSLSGSADSFIFSCEDANVNVSGSGNGYMAVSKKLTANLSGSGDFYYRGDPVITKNISSSGRLIKR